MSRYNSFEDHQHDVQFALLERRVRNLEALAGAPNPGLHSQILRLGGPLGPYTNTSYNDVSGLSITFNKRSLSTLLRVGVEASGFVNTGGTAVDFGVDVVASNTSYIDYDVAPYYFNEASSHRQWFYDRDVPDDTLAGDLLAAGVVTIDARVKVSGNTFSVDSFDLLILKVTEVEAY